MCVCVCEREREDHTQWGTLETCGGMGRPSLSFHSGLLVEWKATSLSLIFNINTTPVSLVGGSLVFFSCLGNLNDQALISPQVPLIVYLRERER